MNNSLGVFEEINEIDVDNAMIAVKPRSIFARKLENINEELECIEDYLETLEERGEDENVIEEYDNYWSELMEQWGDLRSKLKEEIEKEGLWQEVVNKIPEIKQQRLNNLDSKQMEYLEDSIEKQKRLNFESDARTHTDW